MQRSHDLLATDSASVVEYPHVAAGLAQSATVGTRDEKGNRRFGERPGTGMARPCEVVAGTIELAGEGRATVPEVARDGFVQ